MDRRVAALRKLGDNAGADQLLRDGVNWNKTLSAAQEYQAATDTKGRDSALAKFQKAYEKLSANNAATGGEQTNGSTATGDDAALKAAEDLGPEHNATPAAREQLRQAYDSPGAVAALEDSVSGRVSDLKADQGTIDRAAGQVPGPNAGADILAQERQRARDDALEQDIADQKVLAENRSISQYADISPDQNFTGRTPPGVSKRQLRAEESRQMDQAAAGSQFQRGQDSANLIKDFKAKRQERKDYQRKLDEQRQIDQADVAAERAQGAPVDRSASKFERDLFAAEAGSTYQGVDINDLNQTKRQGGKLRYPRVNTSPGARTTGARVSEDNRIKPQDNQFRTLVGARAPRPVGGVKPVRVGGVKPQRGGVFTPQAGGVKPQRGGIKRPALQNQVQVPPSRPDLSYSERKAKGVKEGTLDADIAAAQKSFRERGLESRVKKATPFDRTQRGGDLTERLARDRQRKDLQAAQQHRRTPPGFGPNAVDAKTGKPVMLPAGRKFAERNRGEPRASQFAPDQNLNIIDRLRRNGQANQRDFAANRTVGRADERNAGIKKRLDQVMPDTSHISTDQAVAAERARTAPKDLRPGNLDQRVAAKRARGAPSDNAGPDLPGVTRAPVWPGKNWEALQNRTAKRPAPSDRGAVGRAERADARKSGFRAEIKNPQRSKPDTALISTMKEMGAGRGASPALRKEQIAEDQNKLNRSRAQTWPGAMENKTLRGNTTRSKGPKAGPLRDNMRRSGFGPNAVDAETGKQIKLPMGRTFAQQNAGSPRASQFKPDQNLLRIRTGPNPASEKPVERMSDQELNDAMKNNPSQAVRREFKIRTAGGRTPPSQEKIGDQPRVQAVSADEAARAPKRKSATTPKGLRETKPLAREDLTQPNRMQDWRDRPDSQLPAEAKVLDDAGKAKYKDARANGAGHAQAIAAARQNPLAPGEKAKFKGEKLRGGAGVGGPRNVKRPDLERGSQPAREYVTPEQRAQGVKGAEVPQRNEPDRASRARRQEQRDIEREKQLNPDESLMQAKTNVVRAEQGKDPLVEQIIDQNAKEIQAQHSGLTPGGARNIAVIQNEGFQIGDIASTYTAEISLPDQPEAVPDTAGFQPADGNPDDPQAFADAIQKLRDQGYAPAGPDVDMMDQRLGPFANVQKQPRGFFGREFAQVKSLFSDRNAAQAQRLQQAPSTTAQAVQIREKLTKKEQQDLLAKRVRRQTARLAGT